MKTNQKLFLTIKASLIIVAGLFGMSARSSEPNTVRVKFFSMPTEQEALYRREFAKIWDSSMITLDRVRKPGPKGLVLRAFSGDDNSGGKTFLGQNLIAFPIETDLLKAFNSFTGSREHAIAHEFVHLAVDSKPQVSSENVPDASPSNECTSEEFELVTSPVGHNFGHKERVREFYAELKGIELLQQRRPKVYNKRYHYLYTQCAKGQLDRNEGYPNPQELLLCWSLYQQKKAEDSSTDLRKFVDHYLGNRDCYKAAIQSTQFLKTFQKQRERTLQGKVENSLLSSNLSMKLALAIEFLGCTLLLANCLSPSIDLSHNIVNSTILSSLGSIVFAYLGRNKLISLQGNLYNSSFVWNKDKFREALDKDATRVDRVVYLGQLTDNLELA